MNGVEVAMTESFVMKDRRYIYKVCYLKQIGYRGPRYTRPKDTDVCTLKDLLRLLYTNPKRHEEILELKASCKFWDEIVKSAQASNGTFLYLNPRDEQKTDVVLDVKLQLKVLIVEPHRYISQCHISNDNGNDFNIHKNFIAGS
ncbi:putative CALMODULIN-BINDING PROTEIN60 [Helianthus annuus]|nr:putative CALMODULIN-BINDING PROTEIN60 [Helianthus annuus]KAJ0445421.1 putative CALMODULIN-BINDING PROTEIN60 [Helianthus annuus]